MIEKIELSNFRGFTHLELDHLKRINVIVGRNSSGKTSLLEAIFLSGSSAVPNQVFQLRALRHLGNQIRLEADPVSYTALWSDLFNWFQTDKTVSIRLSGNEGDSRSLSISFIGDKSMTLPLGDQPIVKTSMPQIEFRWSREGKPEALVTPVLTGAGLSLQGATPDNFPVILFSAQSPDTPEEHAKRFSALSVEGRIEPIVEAMRSEFKMLESLSIEYFSSTPAVYASIVGGKRKIPIALVSDGINKLLGLLLGIASMKDGIVLIDQIEDGFYFDHFESIWKVLHASAVENNVQLFVTTHSKECLDALPAAIDNNEGDFSLIKAAGNSSGQFDFVQVLGREIKGALRQGLDPR
jgi:AAA15 family ATPase/GTPase